ncbi:MAG: phage portal protein [Planctomycetota bacterium]
MAWSLERFADIGLTAGVLDGLMASHVADEIPALERLWSYYRNERETTGRLAHQRGLPARLGGGSGGAPMSPGVEVVVENDIAWRIDALTDFVFGKPIRIESDALDPERAVLIEAFCEGMWEASGGLGLLQDAGTLGAVHGSVDVVVRTGELFDAPRSLNASASDEASARGAGERVRVDVVPATRGIGLVDPRDARRVLGYVVRSEIEAPEDRPSSPRPGGTLSGLARWFGTGGAAEAHRGLVEVVEVMSAAWWQVYENAELVAEGPNRLGELPAVHVQNRGQPFEWRGLSDVEPLVPLQDELNTRLSDRAHRVTMQSFNMYLAKGLDTFGEGRVGPGRVWVTDNPAAEIVSFGGDGHSPSEAAHIEEIRSAMDKSSAISPVVLGTVRERLGQLSSATALRLTLSGVLSKTERKRVQFARGIRRVCELGLLAADLAGVLPTHPSERLVRVVWPNPLPVSDEELVRVASQKLQVGVGDERVLSELGYGDGGVE